MACSQCQHLEGRGGGIPGADWIETSCWWTPVHLRCPASMKTGGGVLWGTLLMSPRASTQGNTRSATPVHRTHLQNRSSKLDTGTLFSASWMLPGCGQPPHASVTLPSHRVSKGTLPPGRCVSMATRRVNNTSIDVAVTLKAIFAAALAKS